MKPARNYGPALRLRAMARPGKSPPRARPASRWKFSARASPACSGTPSLCAQQGDGRGAYLYREGLSIADLVRHLGTQEYILRRLINSQLGTAISTSSSTATGSPRRACASGGPGRGAPADPHHRHGERLPFPRPVQPRLQGADRHDAERIPRRRDTKRPTRAYLAKNSGRFRNRRVFFGIGETRKPPSPTLDPMTTQTLRAKEDNPCRSASTIF